MARSKKIKQPSGSHGRDKRPLKRSSGGTAPISTTNWSQVPNLDVDRPTWSLQAIGRLQNDPQEPQETPKSLRHQTVLFTKSSEILEPEFVRVELENLNLNSSLQPDNHRPPPTPSNSDSEEVIFTGRRGWRVPSREVTKNKAGDAGQGDGLRQKIQRLSNSKTTDSTSTGNRNAGVGPGTGPHHDNVHGTDRQESTTARGIGVDLQPQKSRYFNDQRGNESESTSEKRAGSVSDEIANDYATNMLMSGLLSNSEMRGLAYENQRGQWPSDPPTKLEEGVVEARNDALDFKPGIHASELLDQISESSGKVDDDEDEERDVMPVVGRRGSKKARRREYRRSGRELSEDGLGGEDYGDYDIMDRRRPGFDDQLYAINLDSEFLQSDQDLTQILKDQWAKDRKKKALKKAERQELRDLGLLGKTNARQELLATHPHGMSLEEIRELLEDFFLTDDEQLALPPMDKTDRKIIHEIAIALNLKSRSSGKERSRFTILYKTARTRDFNEALFSKVHNKLTRRYFPREDKRAASAWRSTSRSNVQDGEIVGASAPELGSDNKGRAMLERMGWSYGTALGASNNKGILQPVEHTVKKSRAGLG